MNVGATCRLRSLAAVVAMTADCGVDRFVNVPPNEAAQLTERYHDRVMIVGIRHRDMERPMEIRAAVISGGAFLVTSSNQKVALEPSDELRVRIDYIPGDRELRGEGIIDKDVSPPEIVVGVFLSGVGVGALAGVVAGASGNCNSRSFLFGGLANGLCEFGWGLLGGAAITTGIVGAVLTIRGSLPIHLWAHPDPTHHGAGASIALEF